MLLCFVMVMSAGWTGGSAETAASPEIPYDVADMTRYWPETFDNDAYHALELWTGADTDKSRDLPAALYFTTDEATVYSTSITDVETYANEYMLSCVTGENDVDATWDDYVEKVWSLGLQDCLDAEQGAYDRYLTRGE